MLQMISVIASASDTFYEKAHTPDKRLLIIDDKSGATDMHCF
jgi:hypothetical protein